MAGKGTCDNGRGRQHETPFYITAGARFELVKRATWQRCAGDPGSGGIGMVPHHTAIIEGADSLGPRLHRPPSGDAERPGPRLQQPPAKRRGETATRAFRFLWIRLT